MDITDEIFDLSLEQFTAEAEKSEQFYLGMGSRASVLIYKLHHIMRNDDLSRNEAYIAIMDDIVSYLKQLAVIDLKEAERWSYLIHKKLEPKVLKPKNTIPPEDRRTAGYSQRFRILERDRFTCQYCGGKAPNIKLHIDHIFPFAHGGKTIDENLITSCEECNMGKRDKVLNDTQKPLENTA